MSAKHAIVRAIRAIGGIGRFGVAALLFAASPSLGAESALFGACDQAAVAPLPWIEQSACPQAFCGSDDDCRSVCPSDPSTFCSPFTYTCVYSPGSNPGGGSCQSGSVCGPGRFCNDDSDCTSCAGGCSGFCASDGVCRVL
jgi:hypothetical protein